MVDPSTTLKQLRAAIELSRRPGVGAAKFKQLVDRYGSPAAVLPPQLLGMPDKMTLTGQQINELLDLPATIGFTYYGAADYPYGLAQLAEPPPYLFRRGMLWPLTARMVAIVGPRDGSDAGAQFAYTMALGLAKQGVVVVSGGAHGIDTAAHQGALAGHGCSVLVTATGIDKIYPPENKDLFTNILEHGSILTELLPGTPPRRDFFPTRNRIIVGLSAALIIVEGQLRSGTWSSANHALKQQRPILTWPASPQAALRALPEFLLERGAIAIHRPEPDLVMRIINQ